MSGTDRDKKGAKNKPPRVGSSLTDAVVAALAKVEDEPSTAAEPAAPEAGCAATQEAAKGAAPPPVAGGGNHAPGANGFRSGPGSFSDLMRRWAGGAPMSAAPVATPEPASQDEPPSAAVSTAVSTVAGTEPTPVGAPEPASAEPASEAAPEPATVGAEDGAISAEPQAPDDATATFEDATVEVATGEVATGEGARQEEEAATGEVRVRYFGRTDVGLVREHNEDNFLVADLAAGLRDSESPRDTTIEGRGAIFAVCDGMGGAAAGEVASQMAVDTIHQVMGAGEPPADRDQFARRVVHAIEEAGHRIFSAAKMDRSRRGMGTTTTLAGLMDGVLFVGNVGDSRAYVLRGDQFEMISKDQSLVNQLIEAGQLTEEEAEAFEHSNIILQALGTTEEVTVDLTFLEMRKGDRLLLCSDGLSGLVHTEMMKEVVQTTPDMVEAANKLTQMANAGGGHDNITIILADFDGEGLKEPGDAKVVYQQYPLPPDDRERGASVPPRETSIKSGGRKPGADVKGDEAGVPVGEDVAVPSSGGSRTWLWLALLVGLLVLVAGAYLLTQGGGETIEDPPPPPIEPPAQTETLPVEPTEDLVEDPTAPDTALLEQATITVRTDVEEGTLFVNGEAHGPITNGMTLELAPGAYTFVARQGEATVAESESVPVNAGEAVTVELSRPAGEVDAPAETTAAPGEGGGATRPPTKRRPTGRRGGGGAATPPGGLPANPF